MTVQDIRHVIDGFVAGAKTSHEAGFAGVQIHAAHGYLLAQFLSAKTNHRRDDYGGSPKNRPRIVVEILNEIRQTLPKEFCVGIKLNSVDHQSKDEPSDCIQQLEDIVGAGIGLLEVSGGTYENPTMVMGQHVTKQKEVSASTMAVTQHELAMELQDSAISKPLTGWRKRAADAFEILRGEPHPDPVPTSGASLVDAPPTSLLDETQPNKTFLAELDRALRQVQSTQWHRNNACGEIAATEHRIHQKMKAIVHVYEDESGSEAEEMSSALSPYITRLYNQTFVANQHASQSKRRREIDLVYTPQRLHFHGNDSLGLEAKKGHQLVESRSRRALKPLSHDCNRRAVERAAPARMADVAEVGKAQKRRKIARD